MRLLNPSKIKIVLLVRATAVALVGFSVAGALYLDSKVGDLLQTNAAKLNTPESLRRNSAHNPKNMGTSSESAGLPCSLPDGWQAGWRNGLFWVTNHNPNGSIADALAFGSLEDFSSWFETHPDCCDVDVEAIVPE